MRMDGEPMDGGAVTAGRGSLSQMRNVLLVKPRVHGGGMCSIEADYWLRQQGNLLVPPNPGNRVAGCSWGIIVPMQGTKL